MENIVKEFLKQNNIIITKPCVVAVSGGADSVCLLHIMVNLGYNCILAHVNHNLREESKEEEIAMRNLANSLSIPFELFSFKHDNKGNFENDAHIARYQFFRDVCDKYNTNVILTAHHLDDQIESILMKIMEGSNLYGYAGVPVLTNNDSCYVTIRPLLCVSKDQIYKYMHNNNYPYFEDKTNQTDDYLRNRIRHHVTPFLKNECSDLYNKISEYSTQVHEAFRFIRNESIKYLELNLNRIDTTTFNDLDIALKKDIISLMLEKYNIRKNKDIILNILDILSSDVGNKKLMLQGDFIFIREYNIAYIKRNIKLDNQVYELGIHDRIIFNKKYLIYFEKNKPNSNVKSIKLCYNMHKLPFIVRTRQQNDEIAMSFGTKKVNRLFIDCKVPKDERDIIPLIFDNDNNLLWVVNYAKSDIVTKEKKDGDIYLVCEAIDNE